MEQQYFTVTQEDADRGYKDCDMGNGERVRVHIRSVPGGIVPGDIIKKPLPTLGEATGEGT